MLDRKIVEYVKHRQQTICEKTFDFRYKPSKAFYIKQNKKRAEENAQNYKRNKI